MSEIVVTVKLPEGVDVGDVEVTVDPMPAKAEESSDKPLDMILFCPSCGLQHIDEPTAEWPNEAHRSHLCLGCGHIWRPADVATNGVREIETSGQRDNPPIRRAAPAEARSVEVRDPDAPSPRTDGRQPPAGYRKLPAGMRCRCIKLYQQAIGELWCCNPQGRR